MNLSVQLQGGLGNQLFQIWTGLAYALRRNWPFKLSDSGLHKTYWCNFLASLKSCLETADYPEYRESSFHFSALPDFTESTRLRGYFQSYKYFEPETEQILEILQVRRQQKWVRQKYAHLLEGSVSLHFRQGDYKRFQSYHPLLLSQYYERALIRGDWKRVLYFCQSEDDFVTSFVARLPYEFVRVPDSMPDWQQLLLMSCCQDQIIANSTFSWWAAYLNERPGKIIYPSVWFGPALSHDTTDLFPASWLEVDAKGVGDLDSPAVEIIR